MSTMDWSHATPDEIDRGFDHFGGLNAASHAEICRLIQTADSSQTWMRDGARTLSEWVSVRLRLRTETAAKLVRVARRLDDLPILTSRFCAGQVSLDEVDAISRIATAETEIEVLNEASRLNNAQLDRMARHANPPSADDERTVWERRRLVRQWNLDESELKFHGNLPAVEGALFDRAIDERLDRIGPNPSTGLFDPMVTRSADALVEIVATTGDQSSGTPPQVTVNADFDSLLDEESGVTEFSTGALVPNETARMLSCDCVLQSVVTDGVRVVGIGRNSRNVPGWLRRLVADRDGHQCRFPGCHNRTWLNVHHVVHWSQGGPTDLHNLILLCGSHHRFVHVQHWHITVSDLGCFEFRKSDWSLYPRPREPLHTRVEQLVGSDRPI
ncbi:MAG: DUF222 domain-containing protein [Acidimicrobiia bacterium]